MKITYSAPAKVILSGEHAVVFGKPALICAINKHLFFSVVESSHTQTDPVIDKIVAIVKKYLIANHYLTRDCHYQFDIKSDIPLGRGLGSSAALAVSSSAAFAEFFSGRQLPNDQVNNLAYKIEKLFHKNPSGVDNSASCFGGLVYYRKEFEFLKNITCLNLKIPQIICDNLWLIDTGCPVEKTSEMVDLVGERYNKNPQKIEIILNTIEKETRRMVVALVKEDKKFMTICLENNERLLTALGVVSKSTKSLLDKLSQFGTGKITGAGGHKKASGFILFFSEKPLALKKYLDDNKISYFKFIQDKVGLRKEN